MMPFLSFNLISSSMVSSCCWEIVSSVIELLKLFLVIRYCHYCSHLIDDSSEVLSSYILSKISVKLVLPVAILILSCFLLHGSKHPIRKSVIDEMSCQITYSQRLRVSFPWLNVVYAVQLPVEFITECQLPFGVYHSAKPRCSVRQYPAQSSRV